MIVKTRRFSLSNGTLFGIAGGAFGVLTVALMIKSSFSEKTVPGCEMRYANASGFALERASGELLDAVSLQSKIYSDDWGFLDNVAIERDTTADGRLAMQVRFRPGGEMNDRKRTATSGVGFTWRPGQLNTARAACLNYSVWLPADFDFGDGGVLPGLFGQSDTSPETTKFSVQMRWLKSGKVAVQPVTPETLRPRFFVVNEDWLTLPRGKWVNIEQEILLNTPEASNGQLRVWVDGQLGFDRRNVQLRTDGEVRFEGVMADTHYANKAMQWRPAPTETEIKISPIVIRWK